jgi:hypothetical protein
MEHLRNILIQEIYVLPEIKIINTVLDARSGSKLIKWLKHRKWSFKKKKKRRDSPVNWRKIRERTKRYIQLEVRGAMLIDDFDPRGVSVLYHCDKEIDKQLDKIFNELMKEWNK